ncbi:MAG: helix-turn-helix transcriptional regulator [Flavicella sp.]
MPINKHALIRYQTLDACFSNSGRNYYIDDLLNACNEALETFNSDTAGIQKRQLFDDIKFMESSQGWSIPLERIKDGKKVHYRYADSKFSIHKKAWKYSKKSTKNNILLLCEKIKKEEKNTSLLHLVSHIELHIKDNQSENSFISFENNTDMDVWGNCSHLLKAIQERNIVDIQLHKDYTTKNDIEHFEPFYIKEFEKRWYLLGKRTKDTVLTSIPLEQIKHIENTALYYKDHTIDFDSYFESIYGLTATTQPIEIVCEVTAELAEELRQKPLHRSQYISSKNNGVLHLTLHLRPNNALEAKILSYGAKLQIISPAEFRKSIRQRVENMRENYND